VVRVGKLLSFYSPLHRRRLRHPPTHNAAFSRGHLTDCFEPTERERRTTANSESLIIRRLQCMLYTSLRGAQSLINEVGEASGTPPSQTKVVGDTCIRRKRAVLISPFSKINHLPKITTVT